MLISHSHKFIFIKTKKTAGSTLESLVVDNFFDHSQDVCTGSKIDDTPRVNIGPKQPNQPDGHRPWQMVKQLVTEQQWNEYYKFTIERNPWEKVVSEFYWKKDREPQISQFEDDLLNFQFFVDNTLGKWYAAPQDWHLYASDDQLMVDEVVQFKGLSDNLVEMFNDKLNLPLTKQLVEGTRKKSGYRKKPYTEMYNDQRLIDKVASLYTKEIKQFGYEFGE